MQVQFSLIKKYFEDPDIILGEDEAYNELTDLEFIMF